MRRTKKYRRNLEKHLELVAKTRGIVGTREFTAMPLVDYPPKKKAFKKKRKTILSPAETLILTNGITSYKDYLVSKAWYVIRKRFLKDKTKCEYCNKNKITEIHHIVYRGWGLERWGDLMAVCHTCHFDKLH